MQRAIVTFIRFLIGAVFLFSGFVKLIDPLGTSYKIEEYLAVFGLEILVPFAIIFAVVLIVLEFMLGVLLLLGHSVQLTLRCTIFISILFLFLTFYSAYFNKVTDCGCFGDAIRLTPWETFYKNIFLTISALFLYYKRKLIPPMIGKNLSRSIIAAFLLTSLYLCSHALSYLPIIDFRAYAAGKNIQQGINKQEIHDFFLESNLTGADLTDKILNDEHVILVVAYDLDASPPKAFDTIKTLIAKYRKKNYTIYGLSAASVEKVQEITQKYELNIEFLFCDATTLKTMIRSNPGVMLLSKGTVIQKWAWRDL